MLCSDAELNRLGIPCAWQRCGTRRLLETSLVFVTQSHGLGAKKVFEALNHAENLHTALLEMEARQAAGPQLCREEVGTSDSLCTMGQLQALFYG